MLIAIIIIFTIVIVVTNVITMKNKPLPGTMTGINLALAMPMMMIIGVSTSVYPALSEEEISVWTDSVGVGIFFGLFGLLFSIPLIFAGARFERKTKLDFRHRIHATSH